MRKQEEINRTIAIFVRRVTGLACHKQEVARNRINILPESHLVGKFLPGHLAFQMEGDGGGLPLSLLRTGSG